MPGTVEGRLTRVVPAIDANGPGSGLTLRFDGAALPAHLGRVRRRIAAWLAEGGLDPDTIDDVVLAAHEALSNAADHAFGDGSGEVVLRAVREGRDGLRIIVRDSGRWRPPPADPGFRGHGMTLMAGLAQRCRVHRDQAGTTVELYWKLSGSTNAETSAV
ncbi:Histidine kinase-like ATPase domain-containing protein [Pseudonocardia thermophila]|jgi:Signal transduction histidine kinase|uniref:Histidine kinase-like ATPase domain-containing protein n=1 Tax=Pseudonocardia thermophila TaxID=1848 RepID=A0A1M6YN84_PSETH|nr:ATP-binding protein [Pseudonocardia thermophila]SHL19542.1 Histidine kinase-like ATPase domain-containing protein [Pseudonocardia thermophila]